MKGSWGDFASYPAMLQGAATITSLLLLPYSQPHFCWSHPLPEQMGLLCLAKLHPENNSNRAQCPLAAGKNKPQMYFDAAAGATSPSLTNTTSCQSRKRDGWLRVTHCWAEERGASFRIVSKWGIGGESAEWKIEVTLWKKNLSNIRAGYSALCSRKGKKPKNQPPKPNPSVCVTGISSECYLDRALICWWMLRSPGTVLLLCSLAAALLCVQRGATPIGAALGKSLRF